MSCLQIAIKLCKKIHRRSNYRKKKRTKVQKVLYVQMTQNVKHLNHHLYKKAETNYFGHNADDGCLISKSS